MVRASPWAPVRSLPIYAPRVAGTPSVADAMIIVSAICNWVVPSALVTALIGTAPRAFAVRILSSATNAFPRTDNARVDASPIMIARMVINARRGVVLFSPNIAACARRAVRPAIVTKGCAFKVATAVRSVHLFVAWIGIAPMALCVGRSAEHKTKRVCLEPGNALLVLELRGVDAVRQRIAPVDCVCEPTASAAGVASTLAKAENALRVSNARLSAAPRCVWIAGGMMVRHALLVRPVAGDFAFRLRPNRFGLDRAKMIRRVQPLGPVKRSQVTGWLAYRRPLAAPLARCAILVRRPANLRCA